MTISPATFGAGAVTEQPNAHDVRSEHDRAPDEFAGLLAGAVKAHPKAAEPKKAPKDGTSELDRQDEHETEGTKPKHAHASTKSRHTPSSESAIPDTSQDSVVQSVAALDPELQAKL